MKKWVSRSHVLVKGDNNRFSARKIWGLVSILVSWKVPGKRALAQGGKLRKLGFYFGKCE